MFVQEFRRLSFTGYVLNGDKDNFHYMSLSRLHPQRLQAVKRLSESTAYSREQTNHCPEPEESANTSANSSSPRKAPECKAEAETREAEAEVGHFTTIDRDTLNSVHETFNSFLEHILEPFLFISLS